VKDLKRVFMVGGKPFFPLGSERLYSSGYSVPDPSETEAHFKAVKLAHGNTLAIPVYWDQVEPEEDQFNFTGVDILLTLARQYEMRLILLWFATWKNGVMDFAPAWVKDDHKRFKRIVSPIGNEIWVLSSHCKANLEADKKAFVALCDHLKANDQDEHTVIGLQIENEPGIIGSDRDYSPEGQKVFENAVPAKLVSAMKSAGTGDVYKIWQQAGGKKFGDWTEMFGAEAGEIMSAWSLATYMNEIAKAGKEVYNIPMFINVWMMEGGWWPVPGEAYPSGGAVHKVLDIYKWFTPQVDFIAPDNYQPDLNIHQTVNAPYIRDNNPLFIIESDGGYNMFRDIANDNAIGYFSMFELDEIGNIYPELMWKVNIMRCVAAAIPLLLKYQGTGKIHAVVQSQPAEQESALYGRTPGLQLDLDGYMGLIQFGRKWEPVMHTDLPDRGGCLVIQANEKEFYLVGINSRLLLRPKPTIGKSASVLLSSDLSHPSFCNYVVSVDEGHFQPDGEFVVDRRCNGDLTRGGVWVGNCDTVVRVFTCD
jgi:Domain of unknown function (DUF5597)/Beta-galactosidase